MKYSQFLKSFITKHLLWNRIQEITKVFATSLELYGIWEHYPLLSYIDNGVYKTLATNLVSIKYIWVWSNLTLCIFETLVPSRILSSVYIILNSWYLIQQNIWGINCYCFQCVSSQHTYIHESVHFQLYDKVNYTIHGPTAKISSKWRFYLIKAKLFLSKVSINWCL